MSLRKLFTNLQLTIRFQNGIGRRCFASKVKDIIESAEEEPIFLEQVNDDIEKKRDKSRLNLSHRNILFDQKPYNESMSWFHNTLKYKRKILGKYGMKALGVSAGLAWPTPEELNDMKEYERVAFPLTLAERWQKIKDKHIKEEEAIIARQEEIQAKMSKMNDLIAEVKEKVAKKKADALAAKMKKEERLRKIKRELSAKGYASNEKVNEMLEKLEQDEKKKKKQAKKQRILERQMKGAIKNIPIETNIVEEKVDAPKTGEESMK